MSNQFFKRLKKEFNINLNEQQKSAVLYTEGPCLILAVPGGGKTTVLLSRTANLILNHGVDPSNILSVTFSRASAKDMKDRFNKIFGSVISNNIHFSTIHSFSNKVVQEYYKMHNLDYIIIESQDNNKKENLPITKSKLLKQIYEEINNEKLTDEKLEELNNKIGFAKNMMLKESDFNRYKWEINNFQQIFFAYEEFKRKNGYIDYDDMLTECLRILKEEPIILNEYKNKYKYIQVDEAQDTSKVQHEIIKLLAHPTNNVFYVADDDQSIYGFRAAYPEFLLNIRRIYPNAKIFFMEQNYRSSNNIVSLCREFIKNNKERYEKNIFTENPDGETVKIVELDNEEKQLNYLISILKKKDDLSNTAILYRNNISSIILAEKLMKEEIPFYMKGFKKHFFKHWIVDDIISFIKVANDDKDIKSFEKIYYKMNGYYISKKMINDIKQDKSDKSLFEKLIELPYLEYYQKENMIRLKWDFYHLSRKTAEQAIDFIEYDLKYNKYINKSIENGYSSENLKSIMFNLKIIAKNNPSSIDFIKRLNDLEKHMENSVFNKNKNAVTLSTVHSSKGLEWEEVYMIDLVNGKFPTFSSLEFAEKGVYKYLEEERRLFYVGMTRAKNKLILFKINKKNDEKAEPSLFLEEVDKILYPNKPSNIIKNILNKRNKENFKVQNAKSKSIKSIVNFDSNETNQIKVNTQIIHKSYGKGIIKKWDGRIATIMFNDYGQKVMALKPCLERRIIEIVN